MKRLFISCPMRGRTEEQIKDTKERLRLLAEAVFGEALDVITPALVDFPDMFDTLSQNAKRLWYLGQSISMMSYADYFIGLYTNGVYPGCDSEIDVAKNYRLPIIVIPHEYIEKIMPDVAKEIDSACHDPMNRFVF